MLIECGERRLVERQGSVEPTQPRRRQRNHRATVLAKYFLLQNL